MKSSCLAAGMALGLMVCAPVAAAQASCTDIKRLLVEVEADFDDIQGKYLQDDYYEATFALPGADLCMLDYSWDSTFACFWMTPDEASALRLAAEQTQMVRSCLADKGWTEDVRPLGEDSEWRDLAATQFQGIGAEADLIFDVRAAASIQTPTMYQVSLSLTYLL